MKLAIRAAAIGFLLLALFLGYRALSAGAIGDACAASLVEAAQQRDRVWIEQHVKSPSARTTLMNSHLPDLLFVRPSGSSEWIRVGLAVRSSATATVAQPLFLLLSTESGDACEFLIDYQPR